MYFSNLGNKAHIWKHHRSQWSDVLDMPSLLTTEEEQKSEIFLSEDDAARYRVGRQMVRSLASLYLLVDGKEISINTDKNGKPFFTDYRKFFFNVSHSGDWVIVGFSNQKIRLDVQQHSIRKNKEIEKIAKHVMSTEEIAYINSFADEHFLKKFYEFWCIKQSFIKLGGDLSSKDLRTDT